MVQNEGGTARLQSSIKDTQVIHSGEITHHPEIVSSGGGEGPAERSRSQRECFQHLTF